MQICAGPCLEEKLKRLDPQLVAGEIIIHEATLWKHVKTTKAAVVEIGMMDIFYQMDFARHGHGKILTSELDRNYTKQLIVLHAMTIMACQEGGY